MRRTLMLVALPFLAGLLVAIGLGWLLTPRPRAVATFDDRKSPIGFSQDGSICCFLDEGPQRDQPSYTFCDTRTGQTIATHVAAVRSRNLCLTPEGRLLTFPSGWTAGAEFVITSFDPHTQTATTLLKVQKPWEVHVSSDGTTAAARIGEKLEATIWDLTTGERRRVIDLDSRHRPFLSLSHDGRTLAVFEQRKEDLSDIDQPFRIFLFDTQSGALVDRCELPETTHVVAYFIPGTELLAIRETKFQIIQSAPGVTGPAILYSDSVEKYLHVGGATRFHESRVAAGADPTGECWLIRTSVPDEFQVVDALGKPLSPPLPLTRQEILARPWFVPGTDFLVWTVAKKPGYPQWASDLAARAGLNWFSGALRTEVWVLNWRTGAERILHTSRLTPPTRLSPECLFSLDGRTLSVLYQTEAGFRTEFWDFPLAERPWWLITSAAVLAVVGMLVLLSWLGGRKAKNPHRTLMATEAT